MPSETKQKSIGKIIVKLFVALVLIAFFTTPFMIKDIEKRSNPSAEVGQTQSNVMAANAFSTETVTSEQTYTIEDLASNIENFVATPEGGTDWQIFADTNQIPYIYTDEEGQEWEGVRPQFTDELNALDGEETIIQGFMFPLGQDQEQDMFLLGPFPLSCPYHYHVTANLIIEVYAKTPIEFSYDPVNVKGRLELVPKDDEFNVFYRIKDAVLVP